MYKKKSHYLLHGLFWKEQMTFNDNLFNKIAVYWVNDTKKRLIHGIWRRPKDKPKLLYPICLFRWQSLEPITHDF